MLGAELPSPNGRNPRHGLKLPKNRRGLNPPPTLLLHLKTPTIQRKHPLIEQIRTTLRLRHRIIKPKTDVFGWA